MENIINFDLYKVSDRVRLSHILWTLSDTELIDTSKAIQTKLNSKVAVYKRISPSGKFATTYNSVGIQLDICVPIEETVDLIPVKSHRQFVFGGENERKLIKTLKLELAYRLKLKVFKNKRFYNETIYRFTELGI